MSVHNIHLIENDLNPPVDLVAEANHRVANSFAAVAAIVRMHARDEGQVQRLRSPKEIRDLLDGVAIRIETAAQLHRFLTQIDPFAEVDVADHLRAATQSLLAASGEVGGEMAYQLQPGCAIGPRKALPVAMIVAELVTNSLKYAHPAGVQGRMELGCEKTMGGVLIWFCDDGVGLPEDFDPQTATSLGFRIIRSLAAQIGADLRFLQPDIGLRTELVIGAEGAG